MLGIDLSIYQRSGFSPLQLGPALWVDASNLASLASFGGSTPPANNDSIQSWADLSGNGRNLAQATASKMPMFKTNVANGLPGILFDAVDDVFNVSNAIALQDATVLAVLNKRSNGSNTVVLSGAMKAWAASFNGSNNSRVLKQDNSTIVTATGAINTGSAQFVAWAYQANTTNAILRYNGTDVTGSVTSTSMADAATSSTVGAQSGGGSPFGDHLFELCVLNRYASAAEIAQFYAYAMAKWGVP